MNPSYQIGNLVLYHHNWSTSGVCVVMDVGKTGTGEEEKDIMVLYCFKDAIYYLVYDWEIALISESVIKL